MDKHLSIDELFAKARQQAPVASLDETREAFLKNVGVPVAKSKVFTSKKWIMFYSVITITAISAVLFFQQSTNKPEHQKTSPTVQQPGTADHPATDQHTNNATTHQEQASKIALSVTSVHKNLLEEMNEIMEFTPVSKNSWWYDRRHYGKDTAEQTETPYIFPTLTEEQINATTKQKKTMLKALLKKNKENYAYIPSGSFDYKGKMVSVQAFYMQTTEVTNLEYRTFLFDLLINNRKEEFLKAKPDQHMWVKQFSETQQFMEDLYFSHPAYNHYPVVNISREGAEMYCKWLTQSYNEYAEKKKEPLINDLRLPSRTEWVYAASSCGKYTNYPWEGEFARNSKGLFLANHKPFEGRYYDDGLFHTGEVHSYSPNDFGLYCLSGNAAEMVYNSNDGRSNPGTAGGDWTSDPDHIKLYAEDLNSGITEARCTIGFRVVTTYLKTE